MLLKTSQHAVVSNEETVPSLDLKTDLKPYKQNIALETEVHNPRAVDCYRALEHLLPGHEETIYG